jgi:hypothetical protein
MNPWSFVIFSSSLQGIGNRSIYLAIWLGQAVEVAVNLLTLLNKFALPWQTLIMLVEKDIVF